MNTDRREYAFLSRSIVYNTALQELEEILKHKWYESEKTGRDIGFDAALFDWIRNHRSNWKKAQKSKLKKVGISSERNEEFNGVILHE